MSQRECAGFNGPEFSIPAADPISISPEAVNLTRPTSVATADSGFPRECPHRFSLNSSVADSLRQSLAAGVGQIARATVLRRESVFPAASHPFWAGVPAISVGHPLRNKPNPLSDVRSADARSRDTDRPDGVTDTFHVIRYSVEPAVSNRCFNLLTKDDWRATLADKSMPGWPEVAIVGPAFAFAGRAERLTGAGAGPNRSIVRPPCVSQGERPDSDAGEKMALLISSKVIRRHLGNAALVHISGRNQAARNQVP